MALASRKNPPHTTRNMNANASIPSKFVRRIQKWYRASEYVDSRSRPMPPHFGVSDWYVSEDGQLKYYTRDDYECGYKEEIFDFPHDLLELSDEEFDSFCTRVEAARILQRQAEAAEREAKEAEVKAARERLKAAKERAERERIYLEECERRGVDPIPSNDWEARRQRALNNGDIATTKGDWDLIDGMREWVLYGDMSKLDEPWYTYVKDWEKREGVGT